MTRKLQIYLDEDLSPQFGRRLAALGYDVRTTDQGGNRGKDDPAQLEFATRCRRVIVTRNIGHFTSLHEEWLKIGRNHSGIILLHWRPSQQVMLNALNRLLENQGDRDWSNVLLHA